MVSRETKMANPNSLSVIRERRRFGGLLLALQKSWRRHIDCRMYNVRIEGVRWLVCRWGGDRRHGP